MRRSLYLAVVAGLWLAACGLSADVSRQIGARCDDKDECDERCLVPSGDYPGGFCSLSCVDDGDCPDGSSCVQDDGGVCLFACIADPSCEFLGSGWTCTERDAAGGDKVDVCRGD